MKDLKVESAVDQALRGCDVGRLEGVSADSRAGAKAGQLTNVTKDLGRPSLFLSFSVCQSSPSRWSSCMCSGCGQNVSWNRIPPKVPGRPSIKNRAPRRSKLKFEKAMRQNPSDGRASLAGLWDILKAGEDGSEPPTGSARDWVGLAQGFRAGRAGGAGQLLAIFSWARNQRCHPTAKLRVPTGCFLAVLIGA